MRVLVTGATGYVGVNLLQRLDGSAHAGLALVRPGSDRTGIPGSVRCFEGDVTEPASLDDAFETADAVVHLAATIPGSDTSEEGIKGVDWELSKRVNVEGTRNVLEKATEHDVRSVTYTSTTRTHPDVPEPDGGEESPYLETKREADSLFVDDEPAFGYTVVHPTHVLGGRDYRLKRYAFYIQTVSNVLLVPPLYVPGKMNIVPMDTLTRSLLHYAEQPADGRALVSGENIPIRHFIKQIASLTSRRTVVLPLPFHRRLVPAVADVGHRMGVLPVSGDRLRGALSREMAVVPSRLENRSPVECVGWRSAVEDAYTWYESAGLL